MTARSLSVFLALAALSLTACDAGPSTADGGSSAASVAQPLLALDVPLRGAPDGDFVYTLAPLRRGSVFSARVVLGGGAAAVLENTGAEAGTELVLALDRLSPDSVTVEYLAGGIRVAAPMTYNRPNRSAARGSGLSDEGTQSGSYPGGTSESGPTSFHYRVVNGEIIIIEDYDSASAGPTVGGVGRAPRGGGSAFTTTRGERVMVTDVAFTLHGVTPSAPSAVMFTGGESFSLRWFDLVP